MTEEDKPPPPPADPDPGDTHASAHERAEALGDQVAAHGDLLEQLREKVDDLEALTYASITMALEDDEDAGPEKTTVVPRAEQPPANEKPKDETSPPAPPPADEPKRHSGLFF